MNPLLWVFEFVFRCRHRQLSRVFTIQKRTYQVCVDCGRQFEYSWELMQSIRSSSDDAYPPLTAVTQAEVSAT